MDSSRGLVQSPPLPVAGRSALATPGLPPTLGPLSGRTALPTPGLPGRFVPLAGRTALFSDSTDLPTPGLPGRFVPLAGRTALFLDSTSTSVVDMSSSSSASRSDRLSTAMASMMGARTTRGLASAAISDDFLTLGARETVYCKY